MTSDEKLLHISTWMKAMQASDARIQPVIDVLRLDGGDPVCDTVWSLQCALTNAYKALLDDAYDSLSWFAFENDFGRKGLEAGRDGDMRQIRTAHDLVWLLEVRT